jgi:cytosine/uracil/thiamine/allantoin permease
MKSLINLGLLLFLGFSFVAILLFSGALYEKISRPTFKNLSTEYFRTLGPVVLGILIADYFIIKRFLKNGEGNIRQE